ncbi:LON peptidase N-terminal domain and RING finger protein 1-like isoform X3 [Dermochelys coriacea]|uniref:LON peptidase N-terminal domain and RING finger protein 1-like isoform X3 n=1 Tax=Dermochelys coriacea TaxID=27794 RepID=UPI0018E8DBB7|nr:LON peptidase N-terminal domain and RING finger protein 1-like isoform X3 [Dermochelys coriacea]
MEVFLCPACRFVLWDPVTVSCGHSFCKRCLGGALPSRCLVCRGRLKLLGSRAVHCNVLLGGLLEKCLDRDTKLARLQSHLQDLLRSRDYRAALRTTQKGLELAPDDVSLRLCRSEVYVALQQYSEALEDLEVVYRSEPEEFEGYFRKGKVLLEMGQKSEALLQFHHCLTLNPSFPAAQHEMEKLLTQDGSPLPGTVVELLSAASLDFKSSSSGKEGAGPLLRPSAAGEYGQDPERETEDGKGEALSELSQLEPRIPQQPAWWLRRRKDSGTSAERQEGRSLGIGEETAAKSSHRLEPELRDLLSVSDLECSLCIRMFFEPVTTPCGHTFCKECLERCLDHRPNCPLCKQSLREYLKAGKYNPTVLLVEIMAATFPSQLADRKRVHEAEMAELANLTKNIPIFVCTMSFPGISCPLHVFEPRYRLMMRRCQETGTKMFGMCMYESGKSFADYGCMLEIQHMEFLADGRSLVDTIGRHRFRVLRRGHRDGYNTADIEYLEDEKAWDLTSMWLFSCSVPGGGAGRLCSAVGLSDTAHSLSQSNLEPRCLQSVSREHKLGLWLRCGVNGEHCEVWSRW